MTTTTTEKSTPADIDAAKRAVAEARATWQAARKSLHAAATSHRDIGIQLEQANGSTREDAADRAELLRTAHERAGRAVAEARAAVTEADAARRQAEQDLERVKATAKRQSELAAASSAAGDLGALRAQAAKTSKNRRELKALRKDLEAQLAAQENPGGDPLLILQVERQLDELPLQEAYAEEADTAAQLALAEAQALAATVDIEEAKRALTDARPAFEAAKEEFEAKQRAVRAAINRQASARHKAADLRHRLRLQSKPWRSTGRRRRPRGR